MVFIRTKTPPPKKKKISKIHITVWNSIMSLVLTIIKYFSLY